MTDKIDVDDILDALDYIDNKKMNPMDHLGNCIYTGEDGSHCIAGEIICLFDIDLPAYDDAANTLPVRMMLHDLGNDDLFTTEAISLLQYAQNTADDETCNGNPYAWEMAKSAMLHHRGI